MITQFIGGRLFDAWGPSWPFIIVGIFQAFIMIGAISRKNSCTWRQRRKTKIGKKYLRN